MSQTYGCTAIQALAQDFYLASPLAGLVVLGVVTAGRQDMARTRARPSPTLAPALLAVTLPPSVLGPLTSEFWRLLGQTFGNLASLHPGLLLVYGCAYIGLIGFPLLAAWALFRQFRRPPRPITARTLALIVLLAVPLFCAYLLLDIEACTVGDA
jgi:hypothetical protein